jgi:large subunit ribosomal protein L20
MHALKLSNIDLDRKVLADMAMHEGAAFSALLAQVRGVLPNNGDRSVQQAA